MSKSYEAARSGFTSHPNVTSSSGRVEAPKLIPKETPGEMELKDEEALRGYLGLDDSSNEGLLMSEDSGAGKMMVDSDVAGMSSEMQDDQQA